MVGTEEGKVSQETEVCYYYKLLEGAKETKTASTRQSSTKFYFSDYQICSNNFEGEYCGKDTVTEVEPKLTDLRGFFASMALSDLLEDQVYERQLLKRFE